MKLKYLILMMAVSAMGPARDAPVVTDVEVSKPEPAAPPVAPRPEPVEVTEYTAGEITPDELRWVARPVVVFADTANDPAFVSQMQSLRDDPGRLVERDVVVISDSDPNSGSLWRRQLHPRGFSLVIIDKDGQVKLRKPLPWDTREISRAIDKFPLRRQEIGRAGVSP